MSSCTKQPERISDIIKREYGTLNKIPKRIVKTKTETEITHGE